MQSLTALVNLVRYKLAGEPYHHALFRVGMTLTLDPTPFILAGDALKTKPPAAAQERLTSVVAVGALTMGAVTMSRLYLDDGTSFLQLWVDEAGSVAECRFFSRLDQEVPADEAAWDVWLNDERGIIGWPQFQTLDGKLYDRQWSPGGTRLEPRVVDERITDAGAGARRTLRAMLYAAPS